VRKKWFVGALVGVLILSVAGVAVATEQLVQVSKINLTTKKTGKVTGIAAELSHTDPGAQPDGNIPAATQIVVRLANGTRVNDNAVPQCNLSTTDMGNGECPSNTVVGTGTAKANVVFGPQGPVVQDVPATVTAYNRNNALALRVQSQGTSQIPPTTIPIIASLTKKGVLTANIPKLQPAGPGSKVILTELKLNVRKKSKTVGRGRNRKRINLLTTPRTCRGSWKSTSDHTYDDGDTRHVETTQSCTRPRRR
jgi:hypothetical protein